MAKKHDNQHTTPPLTEVEWVSRFKHLVPLPHGGADQHDWAALFIGYIRSTQTDCPSLKQYLKANRISYAAIQSRGGATLWNQARRAVQSKALAGAMEKSADLVEKRYEKEIRITSKLEDLIERTADRLLRASAPEPDGTEAPVDLAAIKSLAESTKLLAETNMKLFGDAKDPVAPGGPTINIHQMLIQAVKERDSQLGVQD